MGSAVGEGGLSLSDNRYHQEARFISAVVEKLQPDTAFLNHGPDGFQPVAEKRNRSTPNRRSVLQLATVVALNNYAQMELN